VSSDGLVTKNVFVAGTEKEEVGGGIQKRWWVRMERSRTSPSKKADVLFWPPGTQAVTIGSEVSCCEATAIHVPPALPM
jgi:hypothetical protein